MSLKESQWKLRLQYDKNLQMEGSHCRKTIASEKRNLKEQNCENHSQGSE